MTRSLLCLAAGLALCVGAAACKKQKPGAGTATAAGTATGTAAGTAGAGSASAAGTATGTAAPGTAAGTAAGTGALKAAMKEHFRSAIAARDAVIDGKLDAVKKAAQTLSIWLDSSMVPKAWRPKLAAMKKAAKMIENAKTLQSAAVSVSRIAGACGDCHRELKAKIKLAEQPLVASGTDVKSHMARHVWAARRLWEGLMMPSDDHWARGTAILVEKSLAKKAVAKAAKKHKKKAATGVAALAKQVHTLGAKAAKAKGHMRIALYGGLLATCAACHALTRD